VRISRPVRIGLQLLVSGAIIAYLLWQIDVGQTVDLIRSSSGWDLLGAYAIFLGTTWAMAWRWQALLAAKGIQEPLSWLTKLYFIGYAASQVLPTSVGGDAVRITAHARRRPDAKSNAAAAVLMERVLGSTGTVVLVAIGLVLAIGRYDHIALLFWLELAFILGLGALFVLLFSRRANAWLQARESTRRLARAFQSVWLALHSYRDKPAVLGTVLGVTLGIQVARIISLWLCGEAVGLDLSPLVYVILGPLLFLVMMVPFTINGLGVREAFFIAFLGRFDVSADAAFATGFLFYAVTIAASIPGGFILLWESLRPPRPAQPVDPSGARVP
jgi:glycosyltransferase 2 family protein